ncbi:NUDIX hydrolase [Candidatus Saccharibacteria bacterium]|nr:NUDIX hydrolase [Candidatus Saccharibacteria bacterium]
MSKPKVITINNKQVHVSAGVLVVNDKNQVLLIDRATPPFGLAGIAGHVDEGESAKVAAIREVLEEAGLAAKDLKLLKHELIDWNWCSAGVTGHDWYLYEAKVTGRPKIQESEVKSIGWYDLGSLKSSQLEPVWKFWLEKLQLLG